MPCLTAEQILAADDLVRICEYVPEWAPPGVDPKTCYVWIHTLNGLERNRFESSLIRRDGKNVQVSTDDVTEKLLIATIRDDDGNPILTAEQMPELRCKSAKVLNRLWSKARQLSGLSESDVQFYVGNSEPGQNALSHSG